MKKKINSNLQVDWSKKLNEPVKPIQDIPSVAKDIAIKKGLEKYKLEESRVKIYGVKDEKNGFIEIMIGTNHAAMIRQFTGAINNKQTLIGQYPEDFTLYYLGTLNSKTGVILSDCVELANAGDFVKDKPNA